MLVQITLEQDDWNRVLAILSQAPWQVANPLIMAVGEQLRVGTAPPGASSPQQWKRPNGPDEDALAK